MTTTINTSLGGRIANMRTSPHVERLVWLAAQINYDAVEQMMEDILNTEAVEDRLKRLFPGIEEEFDLKHWEGGQLADCLAQMGRLGFLAEIHIPECDSFTFQEDGSVGRFRTWAGVSRVEYIYSETPTGLVDEMEKRVGEVFDEYVAAAKAKQRV